MNEDLILTLQNYWFSEKEAKIYLTALSLWAAPASSIARNANESRTTVYSVLWDLVKKWFCSTVVRENVTYFSAVSPEMLVKIQEQKYQKIKEKLPEFMAIWNMLGGHTKIKTFEWNNALKNLFLELATTEIDVKLFQWWMDLDDYPHIYPAEELKYYRQEKTRKGLASYKILSRSTRTDMKLQKGKDEKQSFKRKSIIVNSLVLDMQTSIHIYWPNKIAITYFENKRPYVVIIENEHFFNYMSSIFTYIWDINVK